MTTATADAPIACRRADTPPPADPTVAYILGPPRSGTTMLGYVLAGGSGVLSLSEPYLAHSVTRDWQLHRMFLRLQATGKLRRRRPPFHGDSEQFGAFLRQMALDNGYRRIVIKETYRRAAPHPDWSNESLIERLASSGAPILALIRHPYDVAASTIKLCRWVIGLPGWFLRLRAPNLPTFRTATDVVRWAAGNWHAYVEWTRHHGLPLTRYEDFVCDPERRLRDVCARLQVPFEPRMLDFSHRRMAFGGLGDPEVLRTPRPIDRTAIGRGRRLSDEQLRIVRERCGAQAAELGYDL